MTVLQADVGMVHNAFTSEKGSRDVAVKTTFANYLFLYVQIASAIFVDFLIILHLHVLMKNFIINICCS